MIFMPNLFWGPLVRNDFSFRKCTPPLAGSNPAVYIVGTMYLMRGIMMTKHKGFLSAHPLSNTFLILYVYICGYLDIKDRMLFTRSKDERAQSASTEYFSVEPLCHHFLTYIYICVCVSTSEYTYIHI